MMRRHAASLLALSCVLFGGVPEAQVESHLVWTHDDGGTGWTPRHVALGDHGTQVFAHASLNHTAAMLLSSYDSDSPTVVWELPTDTAQALMVDSAETASVHASITFRPTETPNENVIEVRKWSSNSATPDWTYTYPQLVAGRLAVAVQRDGRFVLAMIPRPGADRHYDVLAFRAESGELFSQSEVPTVGEGGPLWNFDMATDGRHLAFSLGDTAYVYEWSTKTILLTVQDPEQFSGKGIGISAKGEVMALGGVAGNGQVRVFERLAGGYLHRFSYPGPTGSNGNAIAVSDDASTVAVGYGFAYPSTTVEIHAFDVASQSNTMLDVHSSSGSQQNHPTDIEITPKGRLFVVGELGDEPDLVPELRIYASRQDLPIHTVNLSGPVRDVDISEDGEWVVAGGDIGQGPGGQIALFRVGGADFDIEGVPSVGESVDFVLHGTPMDFGWTAISGAPAVPPIELPFLGTWFLDPHSSRVFFMGQIQAAGTVRWTACLPRDVAFVGTPLWAQGLSLPGIHFTRSWRKLTLLP